MKKYLLSIGVIFASIAPIVTVVSCGSNEEKIKEFNRAIAIKRSKIKEYAETLFPQDEISKKIKIKTMELVGKSFDFLKSDLTVKVEGSNDAKKITLTVSGQIPIIINNIIINKSGKILDFKVHISEKSKAKEIKNVIKNIMKDYAKQFYDDRKKIENKDVLNKRKYRQETTKKIKEEIIALFSTKNKTNPYQILKDDLQVYINENAITYEAEVGYSIGGYGYTFKKFVEPKKERDEFIKAIKANADKITKYVKALKGKELEGKNELIKNKIMELSNLNHLFEKNDLIISTWEGLNKNLITVGVADQTLITIPIDTTVSK